MTMRYAHPTSENKRKAVSVLASVFELDSDEKHGTKLAQVPEEADAIYLL